MVSPSFIITAAHCVADMNPKTFQLVTGALRKTDVGKEPHVQIRKVRTRIHFRYTIPDILRKVFLRQHFTLHE